jgi:hypothetical protein
MKVTGSPSTARPGTGTERHRFLLDRLAGIPDSLPTLFSGPLTTRLGAVAGASPEIRAGFRDGR